MRTLRHVILASTFVLSAPAFAGNHKHVAEAKPASTEVKPVETKTSAPASTEAPHARPRKQKKAKTGEAKTGEVKTGEVKSGEVKSGEVKSGEVKAPVEAAPAK